MAYTKYAYICTCTCILSLFFTVHFFFFFDLISFVLGFFYLFISPLQFSAISCLNGTFLVPQFKALLCELKKKKKVNYLSPYRQTVYLFKQSTGSFFLFELKHITRF